MYGGKAFDGLSLTDIIQNVAVKNFLVKAEKELTSKNHREALVNAMAGFNSTMQKVKMDVVGDIPTGVDAFVMLDYDKQTPSKKLFESFKDIQNIVFQSLIGLDHVSYIHYKRATRLISVSIMGNGRLSVNFGRPNIDPEDVEFVVNFAINSVIQIESLVGDIDDPFGHDKWWRESKD